MPTSLPYIPAQPALHLTSLAHNTITRVVDLWPNPSKSSLNLIHTAHLVVSKSITQRLTDVIPARCRYVVGHTTSALFCFDRSAPVSFQRVAACQQWLAHFTSCCCATPSHQVRSFIACRRVVELGRRVRRGFFAVIILMMKTVG